MKNNLLLVLFASAFAAVSSKTAEPTYTIAVEIPGKPEGIAALHDLHTNAFAEGVMDRVLMNIVVPLPVDSQPSAHQHQPDVDSEPDNDAPEPASQPNQEHEHIAEETVHAEDGSTKSNEVNEFADLDGMFEPEDYEDWEENMADMHEHSWDGMDEL